MIRNGIRAIIKQKRGENMAKKKITNPLVFKKSFFLNIAKLRLTPCEFRCLMVMFEGEERTKAQIAVILEDTPQHVGTAMIHLEKLGLVVNTRTEGRNSFFKPNMDFSGVEEDPNQLQF